MMKSPKKHQKNDVKSVFNEFLVGDIVFAAFDELIQFLEAFRNEVWAGSTIVFLTRIFEELETEPAVLFKRL